MKACWCGNNELLEYNVDYFKCNKCNTLVSKCDFDNKIYDVQNEENDLYGKNYWEVVMTRTTGKATLNEVVDMYLSERAIYWLKFVLKYIKLGGDIAEVGCGLGQLQYLVSKCGYKQMGFELSSDICKYIEQNLWINMHHGPFCIQDEKYDGVLALDLFEHLINPEEFLECCANNMYGNGILFVQMPCYDSNLNYEEMKMQKPRFEGLLEKEQHVFLYSRDSVKEILAKFGFINIIFEPAFFGDDYDMFFVASKNSIIPNSDEDIETYLNSIPNGRLIKAMITLFDSNNAWIQKYQIADNDRNERAKQIQELEKLLKESEAARVMQLEQNVTLKDVFKRKIKNIRKRSRGDSGEDCS